MSSVQPMAQYTLKGNEMQTTDIAAPVAAAKSAGLRYVSDTMPGIRRKRVGKHFSYIGQDGKPIHDEEELKRIRAIGIPPAWKNVWICLNPRGHIQATGRDERGRKQYGYNPQGRRSAMKRSTIEWLILAKPCHAFANASHTTW